jgi:hypothetical protein
MALIIGFKRSMTLHVVTSNLHAIHGLSTLASFSLMSARNILLFTLLIDGRTDHETLRTMMYSLFVDAPTLAVIRTQTAKLASFAESLSTWNRSPYSACLQLVNPATAETLRRFWKFYSSDAYCTPSFYANYRKAIKRTRKNNDSRFAYQIAPMKISLQAFWGFGFQDDEFLDDDNWRM